MSLATAPNRRLRLALAQINPSVGDLAGNAQRIIHAIESAAAVQADLICLPELALTGYPPEDLLLKPQFIYDTRRTLDEIIATTIRFPDLTAIFGFVEREEDLYNAAAIVHDGRLVGTYHKQFLPNYGVFDENRYFQAGQEAPIFVIAGRSPEGPVLGAAGVRVGVSICEDIWYPTGPATLQGYAGAEVIVNISASPYDSGKWDWRERMLSTRASDTGTVVAYVNLVGGQDELVFDGASCIFDERGRLIARAPSFADDLLVADVAVEGVFRQRLHDPRLRKARLDAESRVRVIPVSSGTELAPDLPASGGTGPAGGGTAPSGAGPSGSPAGPVPAPPAGAPVIPRIVPPLDEVEEIYEALVLGTRDYVQKNGFSEVIIAISGGIDSALTAAIAVDALGPSAVHGLLLPSRYSSRGSLDDARALAENLGIQTWTLPIQPAVDAFEGILTEPLAGVSSGVTFENVQSRSRGVLLMAFSNAFGWLVLTTGNKSEMAVGYATIYGDMAGGFAVLKDVWKTTVYALARARNARSPQPVIPQNTLDKPPSAELRPDQRDTDSLPPYEILDPVLRAYVEEDRSLSEIVAMGVDAEMVSRVLRMVDRSEYKRRQAAPGVKVTTRAFGRDRRLPLTSRYHEWRAK